jgi:hypothetical protein
MVLLITLTLAAFFYFIFKFQSGSSIRANIAC